MPRALEAEIDPNGNIKLLEPVNLSHAKRALVIILDEARQDHPNETALLSESSLAQDWNRPEEDEAWKSFQ